MIVKGVRMGGGGRKLQRSLCNMSINVGFVQLHAVLSAMPYKKPR